MTSVRREVLQSAADAVDGARQRDYGPVGDNFARIAGMWAQIKGVEFAAHEVASMMVAVKLARLVETPGHWDSWVDIAGYASLGAEVSVDRVEDAAAPF